MAFDFDEFLPLEQLYSSVIVAICTPAILHRQSSFLAGDIEESIKSGGLAAIKTERIKVSMQAPARYTLPTAALVAQCSTHFASSCHVCSLSYSLLVVHLGSVMLNSLTVVLHTTGYIKTRVATCTSCRSSEHLCC